MTQPAPTPQPAVQPDILQTADIGFEFEGSPTLNYAEVTETTYTGDCPGVVVDRASLKARFRSNKTPTGERRRVLIKNITIGMASNPAPYTDREYDKGRLSEATTTEFGTEHSSQNLRVAFGMNTFSYEIRQRDQVIESGQFLSNLKRTSQQAVRNAQWYDAKVCANNAVTPNVCADLRRQKQYRCPNGTILRREMIDSDDSSIRTLFSNQSNRVVRFKLGDDLYRLEPGERIRIRRSSSTSFTVRYNGTCTNCKLQQSVWIEPGKRLKFVDRGKSASGDRVELVDYPSNNEGVEE
jgi:hypothetical protein